MFSDQSIYTESIKDQRWDIFRKRLIVFTGSNRYAVLLSYTRRLNFPAYLLIMLVGLAWKSAAKQKQAKCNFQKLKFKIVS